jgi:hypothetical protein
MPIGIQVLAEDILFRYSRDHFAVRDEILGFGGLIWIW